MAESIGNSGTGMKLHTKIVIALIVGATLGILANTQLGGSSDAVSWANRYIAGPVGQIFLRLLFMVVMPLVFSSIALGVGRSSSGGVDWRSPPEQNARPAPVSTIAFTSSSASPCSSAQLRRRRMDQFMALRTTGRLSVTSAHPSRFA